MSDDLELLAAAALALADLVDDTTRTASRSSFWYTLWNGQLRDAIRRGPAALDAAGYPPVAKRALDEGLALESDPAGADCGLIWKHEGAFGVYHVHPEGFWTVAKTLAEWIDQLTDALTAGCDVIRARLEALTATGSTFRLTVASEAAIPIARAVAPTHVLAARVAIYRRLAAPYHVRVSVLEKDKRGAQTVKLWKPVYDGPGATLPDLQLAGRHLVTVTHPEQVGVLTEQAGLRRPGIVRAAERLESDKRRGCVVALSSEDSSSPDACYFGAPASAPEVKARLREFVRGVAAKHFELRRSKGGELLESREGVGKGKLLKLATSVARHLANGETVRVVSAVATAPRQPSTVWI